MRPGDRLTRAMLLLAALALLVPVVRGAVWVVAAGLLFVIVVTTVEVARLGGVRLGIEREPSTVLDLDEVEETEVSLTTTSSRPLRVSLRQAWPNIVAERSSRGSGVCRPGEVLRFQFAARGVARGVAELEPPWVAISEWGFVERIVQAGEKSRLAVIPNLKAVGRLHRKLNEFILRGIGSRNAPRLGKGREFDRMRDYVRGDDFRDVAWKSSARHGRLIVKEYRLERSQDIVVCLDEGHRMAERVSGGVSRLDHAINAAILLAYVSNRMEDKVGILSFSANVGQAIGASRGSSHLRRVTEFCTSLQPLHRHTDFPVLAADLKRRLKNRTLVVIMTMVPGVDEHDALVRAVGMLRPRHLPLVIVQHDPALRAAGEMLPGDREELSRVLVARELAGQRQRLVRELRFRGAIVVDTAAGDLAIDSLNAYIDVKARQLL